MDKNKLVLPRLFFIEAPLPRQELKWAAVTVMHWSVSGIDFASFLQ